MSNPENQFQQGFTFPQFLDLWGGFLQGKIDKPGGAVTAEGSNTRMSAVHQNLVDDALLSIAEFGVPGVPVASFEYIDNTASPLAVPSIGVGNDLSTFIDVTTNRNMLELLWFSFTRTEVGAGAQQPVTIEIFQDIAETKPILEVSFPQGKVLNDEAGYKGNVLMVGPFANPLDIPVAGTRRFYVKATNDGASATTAGQFAYAVRAFDLALTAITVQADLP